MLQREHLEVKVLDGDPAGTPVLTRDMNLKVVGACALKPRSPDSKKPVTSQLPTCLITKVGLGVGKVKPV